ncbi:restriction endonuclease subunit S [Salmonella enterica]|uniref:restriction endonuclease subunit S n=1 Tax=Salmonella enterica TaxID=28901 RepID=UPI0012D69FDA|nr:restriction endonuclease subunit S [Salmonella enterica]EBV1215945.1 restriction endonuclease subunit S [Salmonella enterica subsp. enterica serovar Neunkirchen]
MGFDFQLLENAGIQLIDGDRGKNYPKHNDFMENGYCLFLSAKNVTKSGFQFQETAFINEIKDSQLRAGKLSYGDIILTTRGTVGNVAYYDSSNPYKNIRINSGMIIIRADEKLWNPKFLYFILTSGFIQEQIINLISGSAVPQLPARDIKKFILPVIGRNIQDKIANIISAFSDKISINIDTNQTLEQMSQTLFKSWFVDFDPVIDNALDAGNPIPEALQSRAELRQKVRNSVDFKPLPVDIRALFPAEFEETELGWVPKGWKISTAGDELVVKGGSTPSTSNADFWENGTIHWTSPKDLTGNDSKVLLDTSKKITELGLKKISSGLLPTDTVLMSSRAPIGYLALAKTPMSINQGYIAIPSSKNLSPEYIIYWLENIMDDIKGMAGGTTFAEISKGAFKTISLVIPSENIVDEFTRLAHQHFGKVVSNTEQINALTNLRDTLLPKLISGELSLEDLPDLANQTEPA